MPGNEEQPQLLHVKLVSSSDESDPVLIQHKRRLVGWGIIFVVSFITILVSLFWAKFLFPNDVGEASCTLQKQGLAVYVDHPTYIANGDEGEIQVTVVNTNIITPSLPYTQTVITGTVLLKFETPPLVRFDPETPNALSFENLAPGERRSKTIRFALNTRAQLLDFSTPPLKFSAHVAESDQLCRSKEDWQIQIASIYRIQIVVPFLAKFGVGGLLTAALGLLWGRIKKVLE